MTGQLANRYAIVTGASEGIGQGIVRAFAKAGVAGVLLAQRNREKGEAEAAHLRDTHGIDEKNPLPFFAVKQRIEAALSAHAGRFVIVPLPNITNVFYGRDVGYQVERIVLDETTEQISATATRQLAGISGARKG